ncbi:MAG: MFS transporter [Saprospiraceae bacterium]
MKIMKGYITRNVWILSFVSLFTDMASEMLYPIMPVYLKSIGFSVVLIGVLEGLAEATAGLSKGYFGNMSDRLGKRLPFVQFGYALSAISKPLMATFTYPLWVFFARTIDRLGKGVRTGARDALLSAEATRETKGRVFGFHRSLDTLGAVIGPLIALAFLAWRPGDYTTLFIIAFIPGIGAIVFTMLIQEKNNTPAKNTGKPRFWDFLHYWSSSSASYRQLVGGMLVFALFNSSDVFLLLKMKEAGCSDGMVIGAYIFYNFVYALAAYPLGILADRIGMKRLLPGGLLLFAVVYAGMIFAENNVVFFALFFVYGLYAAATEGVAKAWITNICEKKDTATAIGTYTAFQSIFALFASSLTGILWYSTSAGVAFAVSAVAAVVVAGYLLMLKIRAEP